MMPEEVTFAAKTPSIKYRDTEGSDFCGRVVTMSL